MSLAFPYVKMPGGQRGMVRQSTLWEGDDHVFLVRGTRFTEEYRRFYDRDVEALLMQKCACAGSIGWWLVHTAAFFTALTIATQVRGAGLIAGGVLALMLGAGLIARLVVTFRYSCRCVVQTAVSREELPSLQRVWNAEKAFVRWREKIAAAQGELPEEIGSLADAGEPTEIAERTTEAPAMFSLASERIEKQTAAQSRAARTVLLSIVLFVLMLLNAAQSFRYLDGPSAEKASKLMQGLNATLVLTMGGVALFALLGAHGLRHLSTLRNMLIASLLLQGYDVYLSNILNSLYTVNKQTAVINVPALRAWRWLIGFDVSAFLLLGAGGLIFVLLRWEYLRRGDVSTT